jgi:hypothetical protein
MWQAMMEIRKLLRILPHFQADNEFSHPKPVITAVTAALACHPEQSEGSGSGRPFALLRVTEGRTYDWRGLPISVVKIHYQPLRISAMNFLKFITIGK